jgi:streptogramin lyase
MNPAPGTSWPDLHYVDTEQVELDVSAIIARGSRLRRRRLITKVAAAAVVVGIAPVAVVVGVTSSAPSVHTGPIAGQLRPALGQRNGYGTGGTFGTDENGPAEVKGYAAPRALSAGAARGDLIFSLQRAVVRHATTLPHKYGRLLAVAGAPAGSGLWFTATAARLTLFHLSMAGALKSWPLPTPASSVRASAGADLAVTAADVAWIGVGSTLLRIDTKNSKLSSWQVPGMADGSRPDASTADSVAVSPDGHVAVATSHSSSVQVLDPREGTFRQVKLPSAADQPLALWYTRSGTLGIGYQRPGKPDTGAVLLVKRTGAELIAQVPQPTAIAAYGASGLLVGVTNLYVVSARGHPRPLVLPADSPDLTGVTNPPAPLPGDRLGIAMDSAVLTFPAMTASSAIAATESTLWVTPPMRCQPHHGCPAGYQLLASDSDGNLWAVTRAHPRTVELISLR